MSEPQRIRPGTQVELAYRLLDAEGLVVESSEEAGTMEFIIGEGEVFPALERAILGMAEGEERTVELEAEQAFGEHDVEAVYAITRESLPEGEDPKVGDIVPIMLEPEEGDEDEGIEPEEIEAVVREVNADGIVIDANHPLAGHRLTFEVKVLRVRG